jgi:diaminohydroxyphosphoribosylaminopyrimidine deaminase/5-amino-6-(5-phosphoribosylamino)uracil reductase
MNNIDFMNRGIELAELGRGFTNPNPLVGAVIVREGKIIAEGYHHNYGNLHAEKDALKNAADNGIDVTGAEIFVTLEPCCHQGKQPPCTEAIIKSGIKKVTYGSPDPNPLVNGKSKAILEQAGIEVVQDFLSSECDKINPFFFHYIKSKMPYVILKYAMTADGLTATSKGESKWITGVEARKNVHRTRDEVAAVMTGIGTVKADDPMLNVRLDEKASDGREYKQPVRIVIDSKLELSLESQLAKTASEIPVFVFYSEKIFDSEIQSKKASLEKLGVKLFPTQSLETTGTDGLIENHIDLENVLLQLGEKGIDSVLVESGGGLNAGLLFPDDKNSITMNNSLVNTSLVNEVHVYISPKIFGNDGKTIYSPVRGRGVDFPSDCINFGSPEVEIFENDILLKYKKIGGK